MTLSEAIALLANRNDLTREQTADAMSQIMSGSATNAQIAGFLIGLKTKGETVEEVAGAADVMREKATKIRTKHPVVVDTCGTGGDGTGTFNISTVSAFVAAGAGVKVAKHGNRSVSSNCGSADVIRELGINIDIPPEKVSECLQEAGIAFLFAPMLHASMKYAIGPRRELGVRTFFNILGPMTNPAGAKRQLMGVYSRDLVEKVAGVLADLGSERAFVAHGSDGLDEITTTGETFIAEVNDGSVSTYTITPEDFDIPVAKPEALLGGDTAENAGIFKSILSGQTGPHRDIVLLNAAFAICAGGKADTPADGLKLAGTSIDTGSAMAKYETVRELTNA